MNDRIVRFYSGEAADDRGRYLREIQRWPDDELESVHDFIQWLFPLKEPSPVNPTAPILDDETMDEFRRRAELRDNLRTSFERMLRFYGLEWKDGAVERAGNFEARARDWVTRGNHNYLRITRILKCLKLLGLETEAAAFYKCLAGIYQDHGGKELIERGFISDLDLAGELNVSSKVPRFANSAFT